MPQVVEMVGTQSQALASWSSETIPHIVCVMIRLRKTCLFKSVARRFQLLTRYPSRCHVSLWKPENSHGELTQETVSRMRHNRIENCLSAAPSLIITDFGFENTTFAPLGFLLVVPAGVF